MGSLTHARIHYQVPCQRCLEAMLGTICGAEGVIRGALNVWLTKNVTAWSTAVTLSVMGDVFCHSPHVPSLIRTGFAAFW